MAIQWGPTVKKCRVGVELEVGAASSGSSTVTVTARVYFEAGVSIYDTSNSSSWSGFASGSASNDVNWPTARSGQHLIRTITGSAPVSYGATGTVSLTYSLSGISYVGSALSVSASATLPARPYSVPAAPPSASVSRVSDSRHTISWPSGGTTGAPWTRILIERWDQVADRWYQVADVAGNTTSWTDTSTVADRRYWWRVRASNSAGASDYAVTDVSTTTPVAHKSISWAKSGGDVVLTWVPGSSMVVGSEIQESTNGGTSWTPLATVASGVTSWTHAAASTSVTHVYRVRPVIGGITGAWIQSTPVQLLAAPLAPSRLAPAGGTVDPADPVVASWQHNPVDGTAQTSFRLEWRYSGGTVTAASGTTASSYTWAAGSLQSGKTVQWRVRTKGDHTSYGPWSDWAEVATGSRPQVTVTAPDGSTSSLVVTWGYHDAEGTAQSGARVELSTGGVVVHSKTISGSAKSYRVPVALENRTDYRLSVQVKDGSGLWSTPGVVSFTTEFLPPPVPGVTVTFDEVTGAASIAITNDKRINLLANPSFEAGSDGWNLSASSGQAELVRYNPKVAFGPYIDGAYLVRVTADGTGTFAVVVSSNVDIPEGTETLTVGVWAAMGSGMVAYVQLNVRSADGTWTYIQGQREFHHWYPGGRIVFSAALPEGATRAGVSLLIRRAAGGTIPSGARGWFDAVTMELGLTDGSWFEPETVDPHHNQVWRSVDGGTTWQLVADDVPLDTTITDPTPLSNGRTLYKVVAWSATPTSAERVATLDAASCWVYVNGGPGMVEVARMSAETKVAASTGRHKVLHQFVGSRHPIEFTGDRRAESWKLSGLVAAHPGPRQDRWSDWESWERIADCPAPLIYRDAMGRRAAVSISDIDVNHDPGSHFAQVSCALTRVAHDE